MLPVSPLDQVRSTLIASFYQGHRPELADLVASAGLELDLPGLWITPREAGLSPLWLEEQLSAAAMEADYPSPGSMSWLRAAPLGPAPPYEAAGVVVRRLRQCGCAGTEFVPPLL
jgi:hypothetical protein